MQPHLLKLLGGCLHLHSFLGRGIAGCEKAVHALYRDDAELTGAYGFEVRMVAESQDIYPALRTVSMMVDPPGTFITRPSILSLIADMPTAPAKGGDLLY